MSDQATTNTDAEKPKSGGCLCCCKGGKSKKQVENDVVVTNQPGSDAVVIRQPQSNGHQKPFTIDDCSFIDEGNETFEEKKWKENGGEGITVNDVSGVKVDGPVEGES